MSPDYSINVKPQMPHSFKGRNKTVWRVIWDRVSHPSLALCRATGDEKGAPARLSSKHCDLKDFC